MAEFGAQPFQDLGRGSDDPALATHPHDQRRQDGELVVLDRRLEQVGHQLGSGAPAEGTQPKFLLACDRMPLPGPLGREIGVEAFGQHVELVGDEGQQRHGRPLAGPQRAAGIAQEAEHQRVAEAVVVAAAAPGGGQVSLGQREVAHQVALVRRRLEQLRDLGFAQSLPTRHACLPVP
jgi:hypothetical protein